MRRFAIRDLLWLTLAVGLAVGWWVDSGRWAQDRTRLENECLAQRARAIRAEWQLGLIPK